jgi:hypothetical protein
MTTAYTSLLGLALPVTGELSGTWGDVVNQSITSLVDTAVAGTTNVSADSNVTLTTTTGASNQARQAILLFSGARTAIRTVTAPAQSKIYTVINATTGGFAVTLVGAGPTTGVTIANGARTVVAWNGSDFVEVSSPSSIILPGGTANGVLYLNGSKVVTSGSALTFDGTNLGIGVSTGTAPLDALSNSSAVGLIVRGRTADSIGTVQFRTTDSASLKAEIQARTDELRFLSSGNVPQTWYVNGSERMRLDGSGNLGLGVAPSAWGSAWNAFDESAVGSLAASPSGSGDLSLTFNAYNDNTNWRYKYTGDPATRYRQTGGAHAWFNAPSGTAGNAITFTQAMTLDANGDLGLQVSSLNSKFAKGNGYCGNTGASAFGYLDPYNGSTGNTMLYNTGAFNIVFGTDNTERARITSNGTLLIGVTSTIAAGSNTSTGVEIRPNYIWIANEDATYFQRLGSDGNVQRFYRGATSVGSISVTGSATAYNTSSDYRLKNITGSLTGYKERLMSLQPKQGTWKIDGSEFRGFLAHEFATPYRASVIGEKDAVDENGNPVMQGMQASSSEVMADLVALVQEQQAIIESLQARLDAANL